MTETIGNTIIVTPDFDKASRFTRILKNGEIVSQSDTMNSSSAFNAVKLFNNDNVNSAWFCNLKGGKSISEASRENIPFKQDPYIKVSPYHSNYQGGSPEDTSKYYTTVTDNGSFPGSWAQITFPDNIELGNCTIQVLQQNYNQASQREVPKRVILCGSQDGPNVTDSQKRWDLVADYDFGTKYCTTIEFEYYGRYGKEFFTLEINGVLYSTYKCMKGAANAKKVSIPISGLETCRIQFLNKRDFSLKTDPYIKITYFTVRTGDEEPKDLRDMWVHETYNYGNPAANPPVPSSNAQWNPIDGEFKWEDGYKLMASVPGKKGDPMYEPILLSKFAHRFLKTYKSVRLVVNQLYGGAKFNIATWNIMGNRIGARKAKPIIEGFGLPRPIIDNSIYNGINTSTPMIKGIEYNKPIEGFENAQEIVEEEEEVVEGFENGKKGALDYERSVVKKLDNFNKAYAHYIHCNGLHLKESERSVHTIQNPYGRCVPHRDYHRKIIKMVLEFTVGPSDTDATNQFISMRVLGRTHLGDGKYSEEQGIGSQAFTEGLKGVSFPKGSTYLKVFEDTRTPEGTGRDGLLGLGAFQGQITGVEVSFGLSKLGPVFFRVTLYDSRGPSSPQDVLSQDGNTVVGTIQPVKLDLIRLGSKTSETVVEEFADNRNTSLRVGADKPLNFYTDGISSLSQMREDLEKEIDILIAESNSLSNTKTLVDYFNTHYSQDNNIKYLTDLRSNLDEKLREIYMLDGTNSANSKLTYDGTMFSGILWSAVTASILYYTLFEME